MPGAKIVGRGGCQDERQIGQDSKHSYRPYAEEDRDDHKQWDAATPGANENKGTSRQTR